MITLASRTAISSLSRMDELRRVTSEAAIGRFGAARAHVEGTPGPLREVSRCVLAAAGFEGLSPDPRVLPDEVRALGVEPLFHLALARFDAAARAACLSMRSDALAGSALSWERMALWDRVCRGDDVGREAEALYRRASEASDPATAVEATVLRVWSTLEAGALDDALRLARLASRMASSERLLVPECLAHVALAHVRRVMGSPHLAARILSGLRATVPRPWHAWIDLELAFVGTGEAPQVAAVLTAAREGNEARLNETSAALEARSEGFAPLRLEARALREACDPTCDSRNAFVRGAAASASFLFAEPGDAEGHLAYVHVHAKGARRVLASGTTLCGELPKVGGDTAQAQRTLTLLCDLALHGPSEVAEVFERTYGFAYVASRHAGAFRVTLHRARAWVEGLARIERVDDRLALEPERPFLVVDPRCRLALEERVLAILGHRRATVAELANEVGVTPRAIQKVMQRLTSEGVCEAGDDKAFGVIDTTFTAPSYEVDSALFRRR
ncbi:MAG: hypothetical protein KC586_18040 [Myxococcales bacterium]|nr:hypothetical protein [Myxococcales bacterium]